MASVDEKQKLKQVKEVRFAEETDKLIKSYAFFDEISSSCFKPQNDESPKRRSPQKQVHRHPRPPRFYGMPPHFFGVPPPGLRLRFVPHAPVYLPFRGPVGFGVRPKKVQV